MPCPCATVFEPGTAEIEKSGGGVTVRATVVEWLVGPLVPLMVTVNVPVWAVLVVLTVKVEDPEPDTDVGLKLALAPEPKPVTAKLTTPPNPPCLPTVTV